MNKIYTVIVLCLFTAFSAQSQNLKAYQRAAEQAVASNNYSSAIAYYKIILDEVGSDDIQTHYDAAQIARKFRVYSVAERYYQEVADSEKRNEYPLTDFWLAGVKKSLGKYDEAIALYERYLESNTAVDGENAAVAEREIGYCLYAKEVTSDPQKFDIQHIDQSVNTSNTDMAPFKVGNTLYYTSYEKRDTNADLTETVKQYAQLWQAESEDGISFMNSRQIDGNINVEGQHVANPAFNANASRMYYNICSTNKNNNRTTCSLYYRNKDGDNWGDQVRLSDRVNEEGTTSTQPSIGSDRQGRTLLFFSSDRDGGKGGMDIWCAIMGDNGEFSKPFNVEEMNTEGDEITPFFHAKSQTVYFSSNGIKNIGGFDIYKTRKSTEGVWETPTHMGYPVNSSYDDLYYSISDDNQMGYFSSNREGAICPDTIMDCTICNDIYGYDRLIEINLLALTFNAIDSTVRLSPDDDSTSMQLVNVNTGEIIPQVSGKGNEFKYMLEPDTDYKLIASRYLYSTAELTFDTKGITESSAIEKRLYLEPEINLIVLTFNRADSTPLQGCNVELFNITTNQVDTIESKAYAHRYDYQLRSGFVHRVTGSKMGFGQEVAKLVDTKGVITPLTIRRKIYLEPVVVDFPLLPLYFDNDRPNPNSWVTDTRLNYEQTYKAYIARKERFFDEWKNDPVELAELKDFFKNDVEAGFRRLKQFSAAVEEYFENNDDGETLEIILKGYASPLAKDKYNKNLSTRRVASVKNYLAKFNNGVLKKYLTNGQLKVEESFLGEEASKEKGISDDYRDKKNSVYSVDASRERKVEVIEIRVDAIGSIMLDILNN